MDSLRNCPRRRRAVGLALLIAAAIAGPAAAQQIQQLNFVAPPNQGVVSASARTSGARGGIIYYYWVVAQFSGGGVLPASPAIVTDAPTALSASNKVTVSWTPATGASTYDVLRTSSPVLPATTCTCAVATGVSGSSQDDTGGSLNSYTFSLKPVATGTIRLDNSGAAPAFLTTPALSVALTNPLTIGSFSLSLAGNLSLAGGSAATLTTTGPTSVTLPTSGTLLTTTPGHAQTTISVQGPNNWQTVDGPPFPYIGQNFNGNSFDYTLMCLNGGCWPYGTIGAALELPASAASAGGGAPGYAAWLGAARANTTFANGGAGAAAAIWRGETFCNNTNSPGCGIWGFTLQQQCYDRDVVNAGAVAGVCSWMENEIDTVIDAGSEGSPGNVSALHLVNNSTGSPTRFTTIQIEALRGAARGGTLQAWKQAINFVAGCCTVGDIHGPVAASASQLAIPDQFCGEDAGSAIRCGQFQADANGAMLWTSPNNGSSTTLAATIAKTGTGNLFTVGAVGNASTRGAFYSQATRTARSDGVSAAWTAAQLVVGQGGQIDETPTATPVTMTTPTAAQIVAQMATDGITCYSGQTSFFSTIRNLSPTFSFAIAAGTGVTLSSAGGGTSISLNPQQNLNLQGIITSCTGGAEAVAIYEQGNTSSVSSPSSQGSASDTLTAATISTTETGFATTYQIPANWLSTNRIVKVTWGFSETNTGVTQDVKIRLGGPASCSGAGCTGTSVWDSGVVTPTGTPSGKATLFTCYFQGTAAPGASVAVRTTCGGAASSPTTPFLVANTLATNTNIATNTAQNIIVTMTYGANTAGNSVTLTMMNVENLN